MILMGNYVEAVKNKCGKQEIMETEIVMISAHSVQSTT